MHVAGRVVVCPNCRKRNRFPEIPPPSRAPEDAHDFEYLCGEWMRWFGVEEVTTTQASNDRGIDVVGRGVIAQAKFTPSGKVKVADVRDLIGCKAIHRVTQAWFFNYGKGFPESVLELGREGHVELFRFNAGLLEFRGLTPLAEKLCLGGHKFTSRE